MGADALVPICFILFLTAIILVPRFLKNKERQQLQDTIRAAIDKGQPLPPEVLDAMTRDVRPSSTSIRDIRLGIIWLAIAGGVAAIGVYVGQFAWEGAGALYATAAIPGFIGLAYIVLSFFNPNKK
jgi:hypothetical protein